jgi:hypothetical protein
MFIAPGFLKYYQFAQGLGELVVVTDRFHVKPLIPIMGDKTEFYVLAISQKNVRFLECTRCGAKEISIEGIPDNIVDALGLDDFETHLHLHTGAEDIKSNIFQYFQQVDRGLREFLKNRRIPLIFAGVDYLYPIYREANTYSCLTDKNVSGNPEGLSTEKLHEMAWPIAESFFEKKKNEAIEQYRQNAGTGLASADITEIVKAAHHGRVGVLFVPIGIQQWGVFDRDVDTVKLHENPESGDEDLLDFAAIQTLLNRGTVYAMNIKEIPDEVAPAAIFRY